MNLLLQQIQLFSRFVLLHQLLSTLRVVSEFFYCGVSVSLRLYLNLICGNVLIKESTYLPSSN